jgi:regulator of CtrA degradation
MTVAAGPATIFTEPQWLYREALSLLEETRDYLASTRRQALSIPAASQLAIEGTRLTARLSEAIAWLMARRAVALGELSFEAGRDRFRLDQQQTCGVDHSHELVPELGELADLLRRSLVLYRRIAALDAGFDTSSDLTPPPFIPSRTVDA